VNLPPVPAVISAVVRLPIYVPVLLPVHLSILLSVSLAVLLAVRLPILLSVSLAISLPIFLPDIGLCQHQSRHCGRGCHSHDQAGNHSKSQHAVLHDTSSLNVRVNQPVTQ
jgi:hypothetical protein